MSNIWFTGDTHYGHKNIVRGTSEWSSTKRCRDFDTIQEHNEAIVNGINEHAEQNDTLYHVGDWSFGGLENLWNFRKRIVCRNIFLCLGNHDHHIEKGKILPNCIKSPSSPTVLSIGDIQDTPHPKYGKDAHYYSCSVWAQELFEDVKDVMLIKISKHEYFFLSHYSHRVWAGSNKGVPHLYGHSHGTIPDFGKSMDIGVDVAFAKFGQYRPFSLDEIRDIMKIKKTEFPDHHDEHTNWK